MKPTVIANANANATASTGSGPNNGQNGVTIPINHEYQGPTGPQLQQQPQPQYHTQAQHYVGGDPQTTAYGSPGSHARVQPHPQQQQQQIPAHFQVGTTITISYLSLSISPSCKQNWNTERKAT